MSSPRIPRRTPSLIFTALLGITLTLAFAAAVSAQVVSDPRVAEFDPSPDHWATVNGGQPAVVRYELEMYMVGATAPFTTLDMGKPSPDADGKIRYDFSSAVTGWPLPGGNYEARVSAVGPEGEAVSDPSNPFTFTSGAPCAFTLSATSAHVPAAGGAYSVDVSTGAACTWTVTSSLSWVTLWSTGGSGNGTAQFEVKVNSSTSARTGAITVGGQVLTLSQDGAAPPPPRTTPTVSWATPAAITQGTALSSTQLNASASVAGTFAYSPATGTVLPTGTHTLSATFTPADTTLYNTATASTTLVVRTPRTTPTVSWATPAAITQGTALSAAQLNATAGVAGTFAYSPAAGTVLATGTHTLSATFTPTDTTLYNTATATTSLVVRAPRTTPAVTWATPAAITQGTALGATQLNATASVAGTFAYSPAAGTVLATGTHTLSATFTPTDTTLYNTATASTVLVVRAPRTTPAVTWATPAAITQGTALSATQLNARTTVAGTFAYSPAAGTVLATGTHTLSATFTPTDTTLYNTATASTALVVRAPRTTPAVTWATPAAITQGTALSATQLNARTNVAGTFAYSPAAGTVLATGTHTLSASFTPTDTTLYNTATASTALVVNAPPPAPKTTPTLTWTAPVAITQGTALGATQLNASASVAGTFAYSPAAGTVLATGTHTLSATFTPADTTLYNTATASTVLVVRAPRTRPAVTWPAPSAIAQGTPLGATQLNASASVDGAFAYSPAAGTVLAAGSHTLTATFNPADSTLYTSATASTSITVSAVVNKLTVSRPSGGTGTSQAISLQLTGIKSCGANFAPVASAPPPAPPAGTPTDPSSLPLGAPYRLTIQQPSGGVVRAAGINCGTRSKACVVTMPVPMALGLYATADQGYTFLAWTGDCSGNSANLRLPLDGARTCGASFIPAGSTVIEPAPSPAPSPTPTTPPAGSLPMGAPYTLTVTRPTGGRVNAAGIDCGTKGKACSVTMPAALRLGLYATPDAGYTFAGWTGDCSGTQPSYSLALAGPRTCSATFIAKQ